MANEQNLKPVTSKKEARERGKAGGIKSGMVRKEKKLMSDIYKEFLAEKLSVEIKGEKQTLTGADLISKIMPRILMKGDSVALGLFKEIRESTEGTKITAGVDINHGLSDNTLDKIPIEEIIKIARKKVGITD